MNQEIELGSVREKDVPPKVIQDVQDVQDVNTVINNSDDENMCVICLESFNDERLIHFHCGHIFHLHCILEWIYSLFDKNTDISCPVCRSIECYSNSPYYNVMKVLVGYNQPAQHRYSTEVQQRVYNDSIDTQQRIHHNNQVMDERLRKGFYRFMVITAVITVGFVSLWIYTIATQNS